MASLPSPLSILPLRLQELRFAFSSPSSSLTNSSHTSATSRDGLASSSLSSITPLQGRVILAAAAGITLHHLVFKHGEWHLRAPALFTAWLLLGPALLAAESGLLFTTLGHVDGAGLLNAAASAAATVACFTAALFASIAARRLFFHRLGSFPGPKLARVSKLWHSAQCLGGKNYEVLEGLRKQYGDYVRTGPAEITVFNPEVLRKLDGPGNKMTKAVWYDFLMPDMGVTTIRNKPFHDQRRKVWTQAFSAKALPTYERQMIEHADRLEQLIGSAGKAGRSVDFSSLAYWFSFDVMGMFALSESFDMLHDEQWHYAVSNLRRAMSILGPLSPVPWLAQIGFKYLKGYWVVKDWHSMTGWCRERMMKRIEVDDGSTSVATYLIDDARKNDSIERDHHLLAGESIVAIVAGSDTVAPTLVFLFYELALHPSQAEKLYEEISTSVDDPRDHRALESLPHLNAVINETMRLHPAVPTGGYRDTPPEGVTIDGKFIPGNTTIVAPRYSIFRSEECYEKPNEFIPERWYSQSELVKDGRSFLPFAQGRYTCLGKNLALSELRVVTALLLSKYHVRFPPGERGASVERDLRDQFTAAPGRLDLMFEAR